MSKNGLDYTLSSYEGAKIHGVLQELRRQKKPEFSEDEEQCYWRASLGGAVRLGEPLSCSL
jgi:hypothetical protein